MPRSRAAPSDGRGARGGRTPARRPAAPRGAGSAVRRSGAGRDEGVEGGEERKLAGRKRIREVRRPEGHQAPDGNRGGDLDEVASDEPPRLCPTTSTARRARREAERLDELSEPARQARVVEPRRVRERREVRMHVRHEVTAQQRKLVGSPRRPCTKHDRRRLRRRGIERLVVDHESERERERCRADRRHLAAHHPQADHPPPPRPHTIERALRSLPGRVLLPDAGRSVSRKRAVADIVAMGRGAALGTGGSRRADGVHHHAALPRLLSTPVASPCALSTASTSTRGRIASSGRISSTSIPTSASTAGRASRSARGRDLRGGGGPEVFKDDTPLNYKSHGEHGDFKVAQHKKIEHPTAEQIQANKEKWGWTG
jgi:hypothetical protein